MDSRSRTLRKGFALSASFFSLLIVQTPAERTRTHTFLLMSMADAHLFSSEVLPALSSTPMPRANNVSCKIHTQGPRPLSIATGTITGRSASSSPSLSPDTLMLNSQSAKKQTLNGSRPSTARRKSFIPCFSSNRPNDTDLDAVFLLYDKRTAQCSHVRLCPP